MDPATRATDPGTGAMDLAPTVTTHVAVVGRRAQAGSIGLALAFFIFLIFINREGRSKINVSTN